MYRVYVAAPWAEKEGLALEAHDKLEAAGMFSTATWILRGDDEAEEGWSYAEEQAIQDIYDIGRSNAVLLINSQKRGEETSGKAVEFGYALSKGKRLVMVGEVTNVFQMLPDVHRMETLDDAISLLAFFGEKAKAS